MKSLFSNSLTRNLKSKIFNSNNKPIILSKFLNNKISCFTSAPYSEKPKNNCSLNYISKSFFSNIKSNATNSKADAESNVTGKIILPHYCNIFTLSNLLKKDAIELAMKYNQVLKTEIKDIMEYLPRDDLELFLLENEIDFEIKEHIPELIERPMVITIMGHVDHGKTTLLDAFRNSRIVDQEFGKITQSIGAFNCLLKNNTKVTFIDTPGHEAFTKMRLRGARVTDCVILVVSGIEGVQKQTEEVISIIQNQKIPFIVAINKVDREQADPKRVREELQNFGIYSREDGGAVPFVEISAKTKLNFDKLEAELAEISKGIYLKEDTNINSQAFVIESKSTKNTTYVNPCASVIIRKGVLKEGEAFICGDTFGRIRHINDEFGVSKKTALPGEAVEVVGFRNSPAAGSILTVIEDIRFAEKLISDRKKMREYIEAKERENVGKGIKLGKLKRKERHLIMKKGDLEAISNKIQSVLSEGKNENLDEKLIREVYLREGFNKKKIIIRADTLGLLESIEDEMLRNFSEKTLDDVIIDSGVGALSEDDFKYAKNSNAIFFCFNMDQEVDDYAISYGVGVRKHKLIYNIIEEVHYFINEANLVDPSIENNEEFFKGRAIVKETFKIKVNNKNTNIAGLEVINGTITMNHKYRLTRNKEVIETGLTVHSLKQNKKNVNQVRQDEECGIIFESFDEFVSGDILDSYEIDPKLEGITNTKGVVNCY